MTSLHIYRPPLTRHLIRCRIRIGLVTILHEVLYLAPSIAAAQRRYIDYIRRRPTLAVPLVYDGGWYDLEVIYRRWEEGVEDQGEDDHIYTVVQPDLSLT